MLATQPRRVVIVISAALLIVAAIGASLLPIPPRWIETAFLCCWASGLAVALCVYLPRPVPAAIAILLASNAGIWAGCVISAEASHLGLMRALPAFLIVLPATWLVERRQRVVVQVVTSWLVAVSLLAAVIPLVTVHPGYKPDHME